jgi:hypothetical protein
MFGAPARGRAPHAPRAGAPEAVGADGQEGEQLAVVARRRAAVGRQRQREHELDGADAGALGARAFAGVGRHLAEARAAGAGRRGGCGPGRAGGCGGRVQAGCCRLTPRPGAHTRNLKAFSTAPAPGTGPGPAANVQPQASPKPSPTHKPQTLTPALPAAAP